MTSTIWRIQNFKIFTVQQLFYKNVLYFTYKLKIIDFKQITRTTRQNNKITIPTIKKVSYSGTQMTKFLYFFMTINCAIICTNLYRKFQNLYQRISPGKINFPLGFQGNVTPAPPLLKNGLLTIFFLPLIVL